MRRAGESRPALQAGSPETTTHTERGRRLAELILTYSRRGGLRSGARLPTERQLALDLGVTRSSVRHALAILDAQGHISREVGRGTFLRDIPPGLAGDAGAGLSWPPEPADGRARAGTRAGAKAGAEAGDGAGTGAGTGDFAPADVMTIRRLLEPPAMSLVVAWATAADLDELDRCLAGGDQAASYEEFEMWDLALHRGIMAASHSPLLVALYGVIEAARHGQVWGDLKRRSASAARRADYQADHRALVAALRARDSGRAMEAMRLHLARVSGHLNATDPAAGVTWK